MPSWYTELDHAASRFLTITEDTKEHESDPRVQQNLASVNAAKKQEDDRARILLRHGSDKTLMSFKCQVLDECNRARQVCQNPFDYSLSKSNLTIDLDDSINICRRTIAKTLQVRVLASIRWLLKMIIKDLQQEANKEGAGAANMEAQEEKAYRYLLVQRIQNYSIHQS